MFFVWCARACNDACLQARLLSLLSDRALAAVVGWVRAAFECPRPDAVVHLGDSDEDEDLCIMVDDADDDDDDDESVGTAW